MPIRGSEVDLAPLLLKHASSGDTETNVVFTLRRIDADSDSIGSNSKTLSSDVVVSAETVNRVSSKAELHAGGSPAPEENSWCRVRTLRSQQEREISM